MFLINLALRFIQFLEFLFTTRRGHVCLVILFLGRFGVDMFLMGKEQALLFLGFGGSLVAIAVVILVAGYGADSQGGLLFGLLVVLVIDVFLDLWSMARFFEILGMSDDRFQQMFPNCRIP